MDNYKSKKLFSAQKWKMGFRDDMLNRGHSMTPTEKMHYYTEHAHLKLPATFAALFDHPKMGPVYPLGQPT